uniref:Uncharacterized protein n=1 Tax=Zea mays TaxID=4577 RepID=B6SLX8_MAIZE|nr:hypothetical protein [Zea mays]
MNLYVEITTGLRRPGGGEEFSKYYNLHVLSHPWIDQFSYSIRIYLESAIRNCDGF